MNNIQKLQNSIPSSLDHVEVEAGFMTTANTHIISALTALEQNQTDAAAKSIRAACDLLLDSPSYWQVFRKHCDYASYTYPFEAWVSVYLDLVGEDSDAGAELLEDFVERGVPLWRLGLRGSLKNLSESTLPTKVAEQFIGYRWGFVDDHWGWFATAAKTA